MNNWKENLLDSGLLLLRIFAGAGMLYHGYGKIFAGNIAGFSQGVAAMGFPLPLLFAWLAVLSEFLGGIFLILGLFTRWSAFFILITMLVAAFLRHGADPFAVKELALAYAVMSAALVFTGGGRFTLPVILRRTK